MLRQVSYPRESLPEGYLWETPAAAEWLAVAMVLLANLLGAAAIASQVTEPIPTQLLRAEAEVCVGVGSRTRRCSSR